MEERIVWVLTYPLYSLSTTMGLIPVMWWYLSMNLVIGHQLSLTTGIKHNKQEMYQRCDMYLLSINKWDVSGINEKS